MRKFNLTTISTKFKEMVLNDSSDTTLQIKTWVVAIIILGSTAFLIQFHSSDELKEVINDPIKSIDTLIPRGQSLVPIRVSNYESLDQLIGQFGVVDLYTNPLNPNQKSRKVVSAVKLIRAPQSPNHFSVLLPANKSHKLIGHHGEFTVVVRNPELLGTKFVNKKSKPAKRRVLYEME